MSLKAGSLTNVGLLGGEEAPPSRQGGFRRVALFTADAEVVDESKTWRGISGIRAWREGTASRYQYTTEVFDTQSAGEDGYLVTGRLQGNFPGGTAKVKWRFTAARDRISHLHIA